MFEDILEKNKNFSLGKIILLFYILLSSSALFPLLSKQWKNTLENNRIAQHILGIMTLMSIVILISDGKFGNQRVIIYTVLGYLWFVLSTKLDLHFNIIMIGSLLAYYLYQNATKNEEIDITEDNILNENEKQNLKNNINKNNFNSILFIILITFIGTALYSNKKEVQYGGGYNLINFLLY